MKEYRCASIKNNNRYQEILSIDNKEAITFFTPTYNRSRFLSRVYSCLLNQTNKNFVWIVVNDGSRDDTEEVMMELLKKEELPIKFISKSNGGKHSAFKAAFEQCETAYFQCMDDDDLYLPGAVDFYLSEWKTIKSLGMNEIGAIRTLAKRVDGTYSANFEIQEDERYNASTIETNYIMKRKQENWTCYDYYKLASINLFEPYWMCEQHKFVDESIWQTRFARLYKCHYVNLSFREYRDDDVYSLTRSAKSKQHYLDVFLNEKMIFEEQYDLIKQYDFLSIVRRVMLINCLRDYLDISFSNMIKSVNCPQIAALYKLSYLPSLLGTLIIKMAIKHHNHSKR